MKAGCEAIESSARPRAWLSATGAGLLAVVLAGVVWSCPRSAGDLYIALAAGRDIAAGKLAAPDDWSFTTGGRAWLNQNWLSHLVIYGAYLAGGDTGLLALKAALVAMLALLVAMACRTRGARWPVALVTAGGAVLAARSFVDLRPNLFTMVLAAAVVWLIGRSAPRGRTPADLNTKAPVPPAGDTANRAWLLAAGAVVVLWAHVHGGFVFGLAMLWLWAVVVAVAAWRAARAAPGGGLRAAIAGSRLGFVTAGAATLLAGLTSPFGLANLTHGLVVAGSPAWRTVPEWKPIYEDSPFGTAWEFFVVVAALAALVGLRAAFGLRAQLTRATRAGRGGSVWRPARLIVFDAVVIVAAAGMAVQSRRFIPLFLVVSAPALAAQLDWLLDRVGRRWLSAPAAGLALAGALLAHVNLRAYDPANPLLTPGGVFERMHQVNEAFPVQAAEFLNVNRVAGPVFADWRWEGYIRWKSPALKPAIGGRAQQIYTEDDLKRFQFIIDDRTPPAAAVAALDRMDVHLLVLSADRTYAHLMRAAIEGGRWAFVFDDGRHVVLADSQSSQGRGLIEGARDGRLSYPSSAIAAQSRAMCLNSPACGASDEQALEALEQAIGARPSWTLVVVLANRGRSAALRQRVIAFLERQAGRLQAMSIDSPPSPSRPGGLEVATCRTAVNDALSSLYAASGMAADARKADRLAAQAAADATAIQERWRLPN